MIQHITKPSKELSTFNIYVDLFNSGEFNEMIINQKSNEYEINLEDIHLGTLSCNSENNWEVTEGNIPAFIIPDITRNIKLKTIQD